MGRMLAATRSGDLTSTKALQLYGNNTSYIDFGAQNFLDGKPFTFCCRIWPSRSAITDDGSLWSYGFDSPGNAGYLLRPNATTRQLQIFFGASNQIFPNYRMVGKHYLFIEYDGSTLRAFRNAELVDTIPQASLYRNAFPTRPTFFGCRDNSGRFFAGVVADSAIYSRILTLQEKQQIATQAIYPAAGAEIIMRCDEGAGTTITDHSGHSRNGTLNSGLWRSSPFNA